MSELSHYYQNFAAQAAICDPNLRAKDCRCRGGGWLLSEVDTFHQCGSHYEGQPHPEDYDASEDYEVEMGAPDPKLSVEDVLDEGIEAHYIRLETADTIPAPPPDEDDLPF